MILDRITAFSYGQLSLCLAAPLLVEMWAGLQQSVVDEAIDQWRKRLGACVHAQGGHFEHSLYHCFHLFCHTTQPVLFRATHFLRGKQRTFELMNYFIFRKVLRNVFSGDVGKLTIY